jgi:threonine dehydrogenase-like Zn-dependent dehydrogenase
VIAGHEPCGQIVEVGPGTRRFAVRDAILITGVGPVGMAAGLLAKSMGADWVIGLDVAPERVALARELGCIDDGVEDVEAALDLTRGHGCEVTVDCSGSTPGRTAALRGTRRWGRCVLVGEGNRLDVDASALLLHNQVTLQGSWVTSLPRMEDLLEHLVRWDLHPERIVTHRFPLSQTAAAYEVADRGKGGKVALVMEEGSSLT